MIDSAVGRTRRHVGAVRGETDRQRAALLLRGERPLDVCRVGGVVPEHVLEEEVGGGRQAHRRTRVAVAYFLDRIHGEPADDVDAELLILLGRLWRLLGIQHVSLQINTLGTAESRQMYRADLTAYFRESFEQEAVQTPDIDYITNDLADFLRAYALPVK